MIEKQSEVRVEPIRKMVTVHRSVGDAFRIFTEEIAAWWPLETHSFGEHQSETCAIEGRLGGRIFERLADGTEVLWGEAIRWDPPNFVPFTWHPGQGPEAAQTLEVAFTAIDGDTRVELTHSGWEKLGAKALETRNGYDSGWDIVFGEGYAGWTEQEAASR